MHLSPRQLFLLDGFGAALSAFLHAAVLVHYTDWLGIPADTLYFLAIFPCFFVLIDAYAYFNPNKQLFFLKIMAYANSLYCCVSLGMAFYHLQTIRIWAWIYILSEILIVLVLARLEYRTAQSKLLS